MSKKKIKVIIFTLIFLVLCFVVFKCAMLFYYRSYPLDSDDASIKFGEKTIHGDKSLANVKFETLNIYVPDGLVLKVYEEKYDYLKTYINKEDADSEKQAKSLTIFETDNCNDLSKNSEARIKDGKKYMQENNFKTKYDILKKIYENPNKKVNIFTPLKEIKFQHFSTICKPIYNYRKEYYYLDGDLTGLYGVNKYKNEFSNDYSIDVYDSVNNKYYYININESIDPYDESGDVRSLEIFSEDVIEKILSSIYFD